MPSSKTWHFEHSSVLQLQCNVRGQQHTLFLGFRESCSFSKNMTLANVNMAFSVLNVLGISPSLQWACGTFAVLGIFPPFKQTCCVGLCWAPFPCTKLGMLSFGSLGHLFFIQMGMLRFGCSGHLFSLHEIPKDPAVLKIPRRINSLSPY